jgi:glycosyltransferase involved in cell wall biosynthesis
MDVGGIEMYLLRFLREVSSQINATVLVRSKKKSGQLISQYQELGVSIVFFSLGYINLPQLFRFKQFLKKEKFDTVCDFNGNFAGSSMLVSALANVPIRVTFYRQSTNHFDTSSLVKRNYNHLQNWLVFRFATRILSNSYAALNNFFINDWQNDSRFRVIYNGVNAELFYAKKSKSSIRDILKIPQESYVIGHIGRFDKSKNHDLLIQLANVLIHDNLSYHFVFCGEGTEKLATQCEQLGIKNNVTILGYRGDVEHVLGSFDLFIFPSHTEGQPNALIEALIAGIPVITSDIPPILEVIPLDLFPYSHPPDDIHSFVKSIKLFRNEGVPYSVSKVAVTSISKFNYKDRFTDFLTELST